MPGERQGGVALGGGLRDVGLYDVKGHQRLRRGPTSTMRSTTSAVYGSFVPGLVAWVVDSQSFSGRNASPVW